MSAISIAPAGAAATADSTAAGVVTVADTSPFYPGAQAWLSSDSANKRVLIAKVLSATTMQLRILPDDDSAANAVGPSYGFSNLAAFTTALHTRIDMPEQVVRIDFAFSKRPWAQ